MGIDAIFDAKNWAVVPFHFWSLCFFVLGTIVGSFLNVCIYRMPLDLSVVSPPSHCPKCKYSIPFYLNIPLVTWLSLGGRCKNCGEPISPRYFIVELLTGVAFLSCWLAFGHVSALLALIYCMFIAGLITATFIDFEHFIIPDEITLGGAVVGFLASLLLPKLLQGGRNMGEGALLSLFGIVFGAGLVYGILRLGKLLFGRHKMKVQEGAPVIFLDATLWLNGKEIPYEEFFYRKSDTIIFQAKTVELVDRGYKDVQVKLSASALTIGDEQIDPEGILHMEVVTEELLLPREAMGLGDVKFMAGIGAFLGWKGALFSLMASSVIGAAVGTVLILMRRREWSSKMPYGPYIALAALIWIFAGQKILHAVLGM